jgi:hypothetical protein
MPRRQGHLPLAHDRGRGSGCLDLAQTVELERYCGEHGRATIAVRSGKILRGTIRAIADGEAWQMPSMT